MEKVLFLVLLINLANCSIFIIFDTIYSPPKDLPENKNQIYNVGLNQKASKPIYAYLVKNGVRLTTGVDASASVRYIFLKSLNSTF